MPNRPIETSRFPRLTALTGLVGLAALPLAAMAQPAPANTDAAPPVGLCKALAVHRVNARVQTLAGAEKSSGFAASLAAASGKSAAPQNDATAKPRAELEMAMKLLMALGTQEGAPESELTGEIIRSGAINACIDTYAARGRGIDEPHRWVVLTQPASTVQIAFDESSIVRSGNRASYVFATRLNDAQPTSQGPSRFGITVTLVECSVAPTERHMSVVYLKPGSAMPWRVIDTSMARPDFTVTTQGSAAERMAQLACGTRAFNAETVREPSLGTLMEGWNR
jgi:hypothetical protein